MGLQRHTSADGCVDQGFCSGFLCGLNPGSKLRFKILSQPAFRLPFNSATPLVMIAAGTGIAPFRVSRQRINVQYARCTWSRHVQAQAGFDNKKSVSVQAEKHVQAGCATKQHMC